MYNNCTILSFVYADVAKSSFVYMKMNVFKKNPSAFYVKYYKSKGAEIIFITILRSRAYPIKESCRFGVHNRRFYAICVHNQTFLPTPLS